MWLFWLVVAIVFAIAKMFNSGFFLLWFSVGALVSLFVSLISSNIVIQLLVFLIVSFTLLVSLSKYFSNHFTKEDSFPTNIDTLIGKSGLVLESIGENLTEVGQVKLDGEIWSAISSDSTAIDKGEQVIIDEIRGVRLVVHRKLSSSISSDSFGDTHFPSST